MESGSTKEDCHEVARRIHDLVEKYNIQLEMVWRRRNTEEIVLWTVGCEHTDAFSQDWGEEDGFFHPPLEVLASVLEKVEKYGARGVIVVPDWPGSEVDSLMQQASKVVELMAVRSMEFESPLWRKDNTFRGWPNFGMRVYRIR